MVLKIECLEVLDPNKLYLFTHTENVCVCVTPTKGRCLANGGQSSDDVDFAYSGILPFKISLPRAFDRLLLRTAFRIYRTLKKKISL